VDSARASRFSYAGTKDKRGVTTQFMTIYHMRVRLTVGALCCRSIPSDCVVTRSCSSLQAEQLRGLNAKLYGLRVGNFSYETIQALREPDLSLLPC
jgi:hypothetical protein